MKLLTLKEANEMIAGRNEVRYERNLKSAEAFIERARETESRNGRTETSFAIGKVGRQVVVYVTRSK